jgi:NADP-dependent 3-hydroxy acid dehydrogenase YdfG
MNWLNTSMMNATVPWRPGASGGIGEALAVMLAEVGARVARSGPWS